MNILITGANQGIGHFMTAKLLEQGNNVTVLDQEITELNKLNEKYPRNLLTIECNVKDTDRMQSAVKKSADTFGGIDIAVHNACLCTFDSMNNTDYSTYTDVLDVNYFGALRLTKCVVPYMEKAGKGRIIFTSSGVGVTGFDNISPYAASKGAIESLAKCLRIEFMEKGITFHIIHPPLTKTKSASPLPVPEAFKADPKIVGYGLAQRINKNSFVICHSLSQQFQTRLCYLFPIKMGSMMSMMLKRQSK